ncbi:hypothetical protein RclHR1_00390003 [Rhizophagus clarus]|nr:hypothetical protein RclHR1_00390003 [Rhizophagus clarus]
MTHRNKALDFACELADIYKEQSKEVNIIGLQKVRRVKIRELFDDLLNDRMEDFYDGIDECEDETRKVINFHKNALTFSSYFDDPSIKKGQDNDEDNSSETKKRVKREKRQL